VVSAHAGTENALIHQQNINFVADRDYQSATVQGNGALALTQDGYVNLDWTWLGQRSRTSSSRRSPSTTPGSARISCVSTMSRQARWIPAICSAMPAEISPSASCRWAKFAACARVQQAWMNPVQQSKGTPVTVLLSHDARIDARRGNQLLASFYLNAGRKPWTRARSRTGATP
jgi:hypothetical protein